MPCVRLRNKRSLREMRAARELKETTEETGGPAQVGMMANDATLVVFPNSEAPVGDAPRELLEGDAVPLHPEGRAITPALMPDGQTGEVPGGELVSSLNQAKARLAQQDQTPEDLQNELAKPIALKAHPSHSDLINAESKIGSLVFGPIPQGHRREFFHDRGNVWIWYEGWKDENGRACEQTVRYEVRPTGVYKKLAAGRYLRLEDGELENFRRATHAYLALIKRHLYRIA